MRFQPSPSPEPMAPACRRRNASRPGGDGEIEGEAGAFTLDASATDFASEVETMLLDDIKKSEEIQPEELLKRGLFFNVSSRAARLLSPIL